MGNVVRTRHNGRVWRWQPSDAKPKKSQRDEVYHRLFLHGSEGEIAWGHYTAATVSSWSIRKNEKDEWMLTATAVRIDPVYLRQTQPMLLFTAPKISGPPWCWPVQEIGSDGMTIRAKLGQVEF